jgi:hypothetical protein
MYRKATTIPHEYIYIIKLARTIKHKESWKYLWKMCKRIMQHVRNKGDKMTYCQGNRRRGSRKRWRYRTFSVARNRYDHFVAGVTSWRLGVKMDSYAQDLTWQDAGFEGGRGQWNTTETLGLEKKNDTVPWTVVIIVLRFWLQSWVLD